MANTLTLGGTTVALADDAVWLDEFSWQPVLQRTEYSITGALVVDALAKQAGQPITLDSRWLPYASVAQLEAWKAMPAQVFSLLYRGVTSNVVFDHERGAMDAAPVVDYAQPAAADLYAVTLRFLKA